MDPFPGLSHSKIIHYLQFEWLKFERTKIEWENEIRRLDLKVQELEAENKKLKNSETLLWVTGSNQPKVDQSVSPTLFKARNHLNVTLEEVINLMDDSKKRKEAIGLFSQLKKHAPLSESIPTKEIISSNVTHPVKNDVSTSGLKSNTKTISSGKYTLKKGKFDQIASNNHVETNSESRLESETKNSVLKSIDAKKPVKDEINKVTTDASENKSDSITSQTLKEKPSESKDLEKRLFEEAESQNVSVIDESGKRLLAKVGNISKTDDSKKPFIEEKETPKPTHSQSKNPSKKQDEKKEETIPLYVPSQVISKAVLQQVSKKPMTSEPVLLFTLKTGLFITELAIRGTKLLTNSIDNDLNVWPLERFIAGDTEHKPSWSFTNYDEPIVGLKWINKELLLTHSRDAVSFWMIGDKHSIYKSTGTRLVHSVDALDEKVIYVADGYIMYGSKVTKIGSKKRVPMKIYQSANRANPFVKLYSEDLIIEYDNGIIKKHFLTDGSIQPISIKGLDSKISVYRYEIVKKKMVLISDSTSYVIDLEESKILLTIKESGIENIVPLSNYTYLFKMDGEVKVFKNDKVVYKFNHHENKVDEIEARGLAFENSSGNYVITTGSDASIKCFKVK